MYVDDPLVVHLRNAIPFLDLIEGIREIEKGKLT